MPRVLTDHIVRTLKAPPGPAWSEHSDGGAPGLRIRVSPRGEKVWSLLVSVAGRRVRHELGAYPAVTLAEARAKAHKFKADARNGTSPETLERRQRIAGMTLAEAHVEYLAKLGPNLRRSTLSLKRRMFEMHIAPRLGARPLTKVQRAELIDLTDHMTAAGLKAQSNRVLAEILALLRWCADRDWIEAVPTVGRSAKVKEKPRDRTLTDNEVVALWAATGQVSETVRDYLRVLLLTGQRTEDVRAMAWSEVDFNARLWTIPAARYKTDREQVVPLSRPVLEILVARKETSRGPFVFSGRDDSRPWNGERSAADQLRRAMPEAKSFVFHDIRRTVRTGLVRLPGVSVDVAEAVIGHAVTRIKATYDRHDRLPEKAQALDAWASHVLVLAGTAEAGEVVAFARAR